MTRKRARRPNALKLCVLLVACTTCGDPYGPPHLRDDCSAVEDPRARWEACRVENYTAHQRISCFCPPPRAWTVVVWAGRVADALPDSTEIGDPKLLHLEALRRARSVDQLFMSIDEWATADTLLVDYDPARGFPRRIDVDFIRNAVDDELSITTDRFTPTQ